MPAHITLLYPFTDTNMLAASSVDRAQAALAPFEGFDFDLDALRRFESNGETVLWLAPKPGEPFVAMTEALVAEFPEQRPYGGQFDAIVPHLTVAVSADSKLLARIEGEISALLPIHAHVALAAIYEHAVGGWRVYADLELGVTR